MRLVKRRAPISDNPAVVGQLEADVQREPVTQLPSMLPYRVL
jgi:hypothetical protein